MDGRGQAFAASLDRLLVLADQLERGERAPMREVVVPSHVDLPVALLDRLEQIQRELGELNGRLLGPRGKRRLAEVRAEERNVLDRLGCHSYLDVMLLKAAGARQSIAQGAGGGGGSSLDIGASNT